MYLCSGHYAKSAFRSSEGIYAFAGYKQISGIGQRTGELSSDGNRCASRIARDSGCEGEPQGEQ